MKSMKNILYELCIFLYRIYRGGSVYLSGTAFHTRYIYSLSESSEVNSRAPKSTQQRKSTNDDYAIYYPYPLFIHCVYNLAQNYTHLYRSDATCIFDAILPRSIRRSSYIKKDIIIVNFSTHLHF